MTKILCQTYTTVSLFSLISDKSSVEVTVCVAQYMAITVTDGQRGVKEFGEVQEGEEGKGGTEEEFHFSAKVEISTGYAVIKRAGRVLAQERLKRPPRALSQTRQKSVNP